MKVAVSIVLGLFAMAGSVPLSAHHSFAAELRIRWKSKDALSYQLTVDDPKIFTAPWSQESEILAKPDWDAQGLFEYACEENNRCPGGKCGSK